MEETNNKIADIVSDMDFSNKKRISIEEKQQTAQFYKELSEVRKKMNKLHLSLWHAIEKNDYRSLSLQEAKQQAAQIRDELSSISK